ncbi:MAG: pyridoxal phosphate-dependent decarboxylase family protein [Hyphomonas sp.]
MSPSPHPFDVACAHARTFRRSLPRRRPRPEIDAAALEARFGGPTPEAGEDPAAVIDALALAAGPGLMASPGPRFFGWVIGASHEAGVAADWLASAWGQNAGLYACSPAAATAEKVSARWLLDILRLPEDCSVGFTTGATMASVTCLAAARSEVLARAGWDVEGHGLQGAPRVRILLGADAHTTIFAGLRLLGFGSATAEKVATDSEGRMIPAALAKALESDSGPTIVIIQAGQINTGAFDPAAEIAALCRTHGAWLHVDGAFGLWARAVPEFAHLTAGLEEADSWSTDGHKWLQTPFDSGFAIVSNIAAHRRAMAIGASYLPEDGYQPSHFAPELSRRARGFSSWAILRTLGRSGIQEMVRTHCAYARELAATLSAAGGIEVVNEVVLNQVALRFGNDDELTRAVIRQMQADNVCFVEGGSWHGQWVMRVSVISGPLTRTDMHRLSRAILSAWKAVQTRQHSPLPETSAI